jgi:hypothetical protein
MKLNRSLQAGSAMLVTIMTSMIIGISLASYLQYSVTQSRSIARSQIWNTSIPAAEAGVEEALAHINDSAIGTNFALNGWTRVGDEFTRTGLVSGSRYSVRISTNRYPIIYSTGYTADNRTGAEYSRTVRVTTSSFSTGMKGIVAKGDVVMNGITSVNSFDSEDERYSTFGRYDENETKDGGYVASVYGNVTGSTIYGTVGTGPTGTATGNIGDFNWVANNTGIQPGAYNNDVNFAFPAVQAPFDGGAAAPMPGVHTLTNFAYWSTMVTTTYYPTNPASPVTTNLLGTMTVTNYPTGQSGIITNTTHMRTKTMPADGTYINMVVQGAWKEYDLITSYSYTSRTFTYSMTATNATTTTELYNNVLIADRYQVENLTMAGSQKMLVLGTNVTLYITGNFSMSGSSEVIIAPGASLKLYIGGSTSLSGNGIFNYTLDASKFMYYGLPSNTSISISGNAAFTGVIYAPSANVTLNGGGVTNYDVVGAIVANTCTMNGNFEFHYDERLGRSQVLAKYTVASWREI